MKKQKFDEGAIQSIKDLMDEQSAYYNRDIEDMDSVRSALSGFGFDENDREYRGMKPEITIPILNSWMNQVLGAYTSNAFVLGLSAEGRDISAHRYVFEKIQSNLTDIASKALAQQLGVGYTYALVTNEVNNAELNYQTPKIKLLDARKVVVGYSEDAELDDCDIAVVIDVISKTKAKNKFALDDYDLRGSRDVLYGHDVIMDTRNQCSVVTVYERMAEGVRISKVVYDKIVEQQTYPLTRIPIVRFYGDEAYIDKTMHYRGIYNLLCGLWKMINYGSSEVQANIATAPTGNFIADPAAIAGNEEAYETGSETAIYPASSWDGDKQLNVPVQVDRNPKIDGLISALNVMFTWVQQTLGAPSAEGRQNETAESILMRRSTAEATVNKYLDNLKKSLKSLGDVLLEMMAIAYDVPRMEGNQQIPALTDISDIKITVENGPVNANQSLKTMQQLIAFYGMAKESIPTAFATVGPTILQVSDIPVNIKQALQPMFQQSQGQPPPQVIQQMQAKDQALAQSQQVIAELNKQISALQIQMNEFVDDSEIKLRIAQMDNETKIYIERLKLAADNAALQAELQSDFMNNQAKLQTDLTKQRMSLRQTRMEETPITPVFSSGRFV